jgi:hypothetical protein
LSVDYRVFKLAVVTAGRKPIEICHVVTLSVHTLNICFNTMQIKLTFAEGSVVLLHKVRPFIDLTYLELLNNRIIGTKKFDCSYLIFRNYDPS